ncbi:CPBP family intramembrane metalloprotease [Candidatus Methylospira mobilis]|uniref:CPBP family intramembrane metalloprotease n=1 Tax=Candidatus Methylospira mobilis TaxID=1808979 RepID=A0A5Q0BM72_9GAMM|nr:CPBP family intramembrane glutamic endopeptidase [Candidatus Methylospira mobilis]QFY42846.1 CPBP family intramembrane metalloprotease [Candidatus Methylospira mobilis]
MSALALTGKAARLLFLFSTPFIYFASCLLVAAALAYPLYKLHIIPLDFHGHVSRGAYLLLVLGIYPIGRWLGIGRAELGLSFSASQSLRRLSSGFGWGVLMLGVHTLFLIILDIRHIDPERLGLKTLLDAAWKAALVGLILGIAEELLFRGFLLGALRNKGGWVIAGITSSFYYSGLHFLSTDLRPGAEEAQWFSGFILLDSGLKHLVGTQLDDFMALFVCGLFLSAIRIRQPEQGLAFTIGIHTGWIFVIKIVKSFTTLTVPSPFAWLVSSFDGIIGWFSIVWISLLIAFLLTRTRHPPR